MRNRILILFFVSLIINSCGIFKTHHKNKLIDFENNSITNQSLKLNGYYFTESVYEYEYIGNASSFIVDYIKKTGIKKIKELTVFFIYEDGFVIKIDGIHGLSPFFCAEKENYENTYESVHKTIEWMLESQSSKEKGTKQICGFEQNNINNKGLVKVNNSNIKIQFYSIEMQNPRKDSFNSAYLYEINGAIKSDSSFVIKSETEFRTNKTTPENTLYRFRQTEHKLNIENYFKENKNRFK